MEYDLIIVYISNRVWKSKCTTGPVCHSEWRTPNTTMRSINDINLIRNTISHHDGFVDKYGVISQPDLDWFNSHIKNLKARSIEYACIVQKHIIPIDEIMQK